LFLFSITSCGDKGSRNIDVIIESAGKYPINGQYVSYLEVKENEAGKLRLWFGSANLPQASSVDMDLDKGWFVYGESQTRFWVSDGYGALKLLEYSGPPGDEKLTNRAYSKAEIPKKIVLMIPKSTEVTEEAEQDAAGGQPVARPESKSEGGEKPQLESERSSR
jgi:hypothetical protein